MSSARRSSSPSSQRCRSYRRAREGERIKEIAAFVVRVADTPDGYSQWPAYAAADDRVQSVFKRFGLPDHLD